jgi:hypothetical protein
LFLFTKGVAYRCASAKRHFWLRFSRFSRFTKGLSQSEKRARFTFGDAKPLVARSDTFGEAKRARESPLVKRITEGFALRAKGRR